MSASSFSRPGAVDLSALAARAKQQREAASRPPAPPGAPGAPSSAVEAGLVIDVTEVNFATGVVDQSMTVPVLLVFSSTRSPASVQLLSVLEALVVDYAGQFLLGRIDVDLNPQLAAAAQVPAQGGPVVLGVLKGQILPLFQGALPGAQVRPYLDEMLKIAQANGVVGRIEVQSAPAEPDAAPAEPEIDPRYVPAMEAFEQGDVEGARAEYKKLLDAAPADAEAKAGYVLTSVMARALAVDEATVRAAADADPADVEAQAALADVEATGGQLDLAFDRLIRAVQLTSGAERETARTRLVELFELAGQDDPRVPKARRALASALF
jgi:putative thioredoxin